MLATPFRRMYTHALISSRHTKPIVSSNPLRYILSSSHRWGFHLMKQGLLPIVTPTTITSPTTITPGPTTVPTATITPPTSVPTTAKVEGMEGERRGG